MVLIIGAMFLLSMAAFLTHDTLKEIKEMINVE